MNNIQKYADFMDQHWKELVDYINAEFESYKEKITGAFLTQVQIFSTLIPVHYKLIDVPDVYEVYQRKKKRKVSVQQSTVAQDYLAGYRNPETEMQQYGQKRLIKDGKISLDQTVLDFLENEYTGEIEKIDDSDELYYITYSDYMTELLMNICEDIFREAVIKYLCKYFHSNISNDMYGEISELSQKFGHIFERTEVVHYVFAETAANYLGISEVKLCDIEDILNTFHNGSLQ